MLCVRATEQGNQRAAREACRDQLIRGVCSEGGAVSESGEATLREGCFGTVRAELLHRSSLTANPEAGWTTSPFRS